VHAADSSQGSRPSACDTGDPGRGQRLLALAREVLDGSRPRWEDEDGNGPLPPDPPDGWQPWLLAPAATFVSLELAGGLRGCMGTLWPHQRLVDDVRVNARAAAFRDPRFPRLAVAELHAARISVSLLGELQPLAATTFDAAASLLRPGLDGAVVTLGSRRATLLPQVWRDLPDPRDFVAALARKAGLTGPHDRPPGALRFLRYEVESWSE
jgi:AmmeMemoRadiSam system protein A